MHDKTTCDVHNVNSTDQAKLNHFIDIKGVWTAAHKNTQKMTS